MSIEIDVGKFLPELLVHTIQDNSESATIDRSKKISEDKESNSKGEIDASVVYAIGGNWRGITGEVIDAVAPQENISTIQGWDYIEDRVSYMSYDTEPVIDSILKLFSNFNTEEKINFIQTVLDRSGMTDEIIKYFKKEGF